MDAVPPRSASIDLSEAVGWITPFCRETCSESEELWMSKRVERPARRERGPSGKELALASFIAAAYGLGTVAISPIGYGPVQARLTDALIPLAHNKKIGKAAVYGTTLGTIVANVISPYGLPDVIVGALTNLVASYIAYKLQRAGGWKGRALATLLPSIAVGVLIGGVLLALIYQLPVTLTIPSVTAGALISCMGLGWPLLEALQRLLK